MLTALPPASEVSVKPQSIDSEIPMEPITMMRNAMGHQTCVLTALCSAAFEVTLYYASI